MTTALVVSRIVVFLYAAALSYWTYRVACGRHPLHNVGKERWYAFVLLAIAVCSIEFPKSACIVLAICLSVIWTVDPLESGCLFAVLVIAAIGYQLAERADSKRNALPQRHA